MYFSSLNNVDSRGIAERVRNKTLSICFLPELILTSNKTILSVRDYGYDTLTRETLSVLSSTSGNCG